MKYYYLASTSLTADTVIEANLVCTAWLGLSEFQRVYRLQRLSFGLA